MVCFGLHITFSKSDLHLSHVLLGYVGILSICQYLLPLAKLADIQQLALSLLQTQHVMEHMVMSFLEKANFSHIIQSDILTVYHSLAHLFFSVQFSISALHQLEQLSHLQQSPVLLHLLLSDVVIAKDVMPSHWAFCFQGSELLLSVSESWSGSMCEAHIALQELQTVAMMLCRMVFCLLGKVVALHLDNCTVKAYLCYPGGTLSPFLSRLACWILCLTDKHSITLILAYIPAYLNVEDTYMSWGWLLME